MNDSDLIDWYDIVESVANGRLSGHRCPMCTAGTLEASNDGVTVTMRCPECGQGFTGKMAHGRDDALYAEADRILKAQAAARAAPAAAQPPAAVASLSPEVVETQAVVGRAATPPEPERGPWEWALPAGSGSADGYAIWAEVVEAIYNGRRSGLKCPLCSEPITDVTVRRPYLRARCDVCGEGFEGKVG